MDESAAQIDDTVGDLVGAGVFQPLVNRVEELFLLVDRKHDGVAGADVPERLADRSLARREPVENLLACVPADHDRLLDARKLDLDAVQLVPVYPRDETQSTAEPLSRPMSTHRDTGRKGTGPAGSWPRTPARLILTAAVRTTGG